MLRLVVLDTKKLNYRIFEGKKCVAEFVVTNNIPLEPAMVEHMRIANYTAA